MPIMDAHLKAVFVLNFTKHHAQHCDIDALSFKVFDLKGTLMLHQECSVCGAAGTTSLMDVEDFNARYPGAHRSVNDDGLPF
jgi:hypothetical protein